MQTLDERIKAAEEKFEKVRQEMENRAVERFLKNNPKPKRYNAANAFDDLLWNDDWYRWNEQLQEVVYRVHSSSLDTVEYDEYMRLVDLKNRCNISAEVENYSEGYVNYKVYADGSQVADFQNADCVNKKYF